MGRFDPTYTDTQRDAVAAAINQRGLSAPDVSHRAGAGELTEDLPSFEIPETTVRDIAAAERKAQPACPEAQAARLIKVVDETLTMAERDLEALKAKQRENGHLENADLTRLTKLARTLKANLELSNALKSSGGPTSPAATHRTSSSDFLERLHADLQGETEAPNGAGPPSP